MKPAPHRRWLTATIAAVLATGAAGKPAPEPAPAPIPATPPAAPPAAAQPPAAEAPAAEAPAAESPAAEPAAEFPPAAEPAGPPRPWPPGVHPRDFGPDGRRGHDWRRREWSRISTSWLGVGIERPTEELCSQLPELPSGTGFVVATIEPSGPAEAAGLLAHDVLWRLDDQLLINEAQLAVLLGLHQPGEMVRIDYYRGGKLLQAAVKLGKPPARPDFRVARGGGPFGPPEPQVPLHIVNVPSRSASVEHPDGRAVLTVDGGGFQLTISDPEGRTIHEGQLFDAKGAILAPEAWHERVEALHATLVESMRRTQASRPPRVRVIPRSESD